MSQESFVPPGSHPVLRALDVVEDALKDLALVDPGFMSTSDKRAALVRQARVEARLKELGLRVLASSGDVAVDEGARDVAGWVDHHNRVDRPTARREQRLAEGLQERWRRVQAGMRQGEVNAEQAHVITQALDALPDGLDPEVVAAAEERLVAEAAHFGPRELKVMGRRILDIVAPELGEEAERKALEAEERHAAKKIYLTGRRLGDGSTEVRGNLPDATWDRLTTYLEAYTSPRQPRQQHAYEPGESGNPEDRRPYEMRLGSAFVSFLEHVDPQRLPLHGGDATTVVVTIDHTTLDNQVGSSGVAIIDDQPLSAAAVRRLACTANIIPAVLGGQSEVLDLGRSRRLFSRAQRRALALRHRRCRARNCRIKAAWTEAHHLRRPWAQGGTTDLDDGTLLCCFHHHKAHDPRYETRVHPDGDLTFHRRT
ncbi:HNH endonuclease signature motif containing protein [Nocardioides dilutus]